MSGLPDFKCKNVQVAGILPSACRGPVQPVSDVLAKSVAASVMPKSQVLNVVSTPPMFEFLFGNPILLRMICALSPVNVMVATTLPEESKLLASMLYCVPLLYEVLFNHVLPPVEWLA
jgi:hypothetical protein